MEESNGAQCKRGEDAEGEEGRRTNGEKRKEERERKINKWCLGEGD